MNEPKKLICNWHQTAHIFEPYLQEGRDNPAWSYIDSKDPKMIPSTAKMICLWIDGMIPTMIFDETYFQDNVDRFNKLTAHVVYRYTTTESIKVYLKMKWDI